MYNKRIKIFITILAAFLLLCLLRLTDMQLLPDPSLQEDIAELKRERSRYRQLKTLRGTIFDRKDRTLACDEPRFGLHINYDLTRFLDPRVRQAKLLRTPQLKQQEMKQFLQTKVEDLRELIEKCVRFGRPHEEITKRIDQINNRTWNLRTFLAWRRNNPSPEILKKYNNRITSIPISKAVADFQKTHPDENQRLVLISKVDDIPETKKDHQLLELKTDDDIFAAQLEFINVPGVKILPTAARSYPYGSVAAHSIGWVGPPQERDQKLFAADRLTSYLTGEVCGRGDGTEYVCETLLRGTRGELVYDIDRQLQTQTPTRFGSDTRLTIDIELQKRIEQYITNPDLNKYSTLPTAAAVIDVVTGDILALVSLPAFDLNKIRYNYNSIAADPSKPMMNRAIYKQFPPGSVIKPLILIAGLEEQKITADEVISCPHQKTPKGWPNCLEFRKFSSCHDWKWEGQGGNNARNAIRGSCNVYFSRLAGRIEPRALQSWLFKFGLGRTFSLAPDQIIKSQSPRDFRQSQGQISNSPAPRNITHLDQVPKLESTERRYFGMGQGNLRTTPLQIANAMAAIARGGWYKPPSLFLEDDSQPQWISLDISEPTLATVRDGMRAVVTESGGTAYRVFAPADFDAQGVTAFGKTGSTQNPENAWFAGFAEDAFGRGLAIAVLVEKGKSGSRYAAPIGRDILQFCLEAGYIGPTTP